MGNEPIQGDGRGTYVALARRRPREGGMAYRARALGSRSCRSSRGGDGPPGRSGKPATGRRAAGGRQEGREGGEMPSANLRDGASTGEPCAAKAACTVRGGAVGKRVAQTRTPLAAYSTLPICVRRTAP